MTKTCTHIQCDVNANCLSMYSLCREHFKLLKQSKTVAMHSITWHCKSVCYNMDMRKC